MNEAPLVDAVLAYGLPFALLLFAYATNRWSHTRANLVRIAENERDGLDEPASLHPVIDPARCLGCGACVKACPEADVLGLVRGKAVLTHPTHCIGHGACRASCPTDAIELVLGTARRGVTVPVLDERFETSVPGIFVAGELGGMGLIRNAIEQGRQALVEVAGSLDHHDTDALDVLVVGAGPAGLSAGLAAHERGLDYAVVDQDTIGGTVAHYPRGKVVMTAPATLPIVGRIELGVTSKEDLMALWDRVVRETSLRVRERTRIESIRREGALFVAETSAGPISARRILLAIGRRGSPRRLGVPGEDLPKVVYRLVDPAQYRDLHVLVVGGGDSALEAAGSIADEPGTNVTLSYRGRAFQRAKQPNRERISRCEDGGRLEVHLESEVVRIDDGSVDISVGGRNRRIRNDAVIVCAGGELPTAFLSAIGIEMETRHGEPI